MQDKRTFYSQPRIAQGYDQLRFGSASGAWVNQREIEWVRLLIGTSERVLDLACGTGRLTHSLEADTRVIGMDSSAAMLEEARHSARSPFVQADAFSLPFAAKSFTSIVALRFVFHLPSPNRFLQEAQHLLAPHGNLVFDTYQWSPRALAAHDRGRWGSQVYAHPPREIERMATTLGYRVGACETGFLFSPYLYRRLPLPIVKQLDRLERRVPAKLHARAFWMLTLDSF